MACAQWRRLQRHTWPKMPEPVRPRSRLDDCDRQMLAVLRSGQDVFNDDEHRVMSADAAGVHEDDWIERNPPALSPEILPRFRRRRGHGWRNRTIPDHLIFGRDV